MPTEAANPYESPDYACGGGPVSWRVLTPLYASETAVILTAALYLGMLLTRDAFVQLYFDFGHELPYPTIIAMSPYSLIGAAVLMVATIVQHFAVQNRSVVRLWNATACVLSIVFAFCYVIAAFIPFIVLVQNIE